MARCWLRVPVLGGSCAGGGAGASTPGTALRERVRPRVEVVVGAGTSLAGCVWSGAISGDVVGVCARFCFLFLSVLRDVDLLRDVEAWAGFLLELSVLAVFKPHLYSRKITGTTATSSFSHVRYMSSASKKTHLAAACGSATITM